ncbi:UNVERIFIED_CONTAM: hypothetical protein FKN15_065001 [Acipenser sinensis]
MFWSSLPAGPGPEFMKSVFNLWGYSPLVQCYFRNQKTDIRAGMDILVQRTEILNLPPYPFFALLPCYFRNQKTDIRAGMDILVQRTEILNLPPYPFFALLPVFKGKEYDSDYDDVENIVGPPVKSACGTGAIVLLYILLIISFVMWGVLLYVAIVKYSEISTEVQNLTMELSMIRENGISSQVRSMKTDISQLKTEGFQCAQLGIGTKPVHLGIRSAVLQSNSSHNKALSTLQVSRRDCKVIQLV